MDFHEINNQGKIWIQRIDDINDISYSTSDESRILYSKSDEKIYIGTDSEWLALATNYSVISLNTKMIFGSYPLPTGWNIKNENDVLVSITNNSGSIGAKAGDWSITSVQNSQPHNHGGFTGSASSGMTGHRIIKDTGFISTAPSTHKHSIYSDGIHTHTFDGTWRPARRHFIEAIRI